jgi:ubiquinone/menaquinone biosynthesis C-methylase UbiE
VVGVRVDVEQPRAAGHERRRQRVDRRLDASLGEVRDGLERPRHARSLGSVKAYYDRRAPEYDEWYRGVGQYAERDRPGWHDEVDALTGALAALPPARTLDVACGTGFLTRHLAGYVVALDQSRAMVAIAQHRLPDGLALVGDSLALPFADGAFDRLFTGHFYGHLPSAERDRFLAEAARVARELVVVDTAFREGVAAEGYEERRLNDGSTHRVFKRYLVATELAEELAGEVLYAGRWFVAVRAPLVRRA